LLLTTFYRPVGNKKKILVEYNPFSSDWYALESHARLHGYNPDEVIVEIKSDKPFYLSTEKILERINSLKEETALILFSGVNYLTGQVFDMEAIAKEASKHSIPVGLDLAHAIGNVPLKLHEWNVDFAVWCSYKYLNSGPGGTGGYFVHEKHGKNKDLLRLAGWWGHNEVERFKMEKGFNPIPTAEGWQLSNAPVLSLAAQWASLQIFQEAGMENIRKKSIGLTGYLEYLLKTLIIEKENPYGVEIITPDSIEERGCQLSLQFKRGALEVLEKITDAGFVVDFRNPDIIRVSPAPLFNTYKEVFSFVNFLARL
jgi:kynureninase